MTPFRFPLEKVLEWRRRELEREEQKLKRAFTAITDLDRRHAELEDSRIGEETHLRQRGPLDGLDLAALDQFRRRLKRQQKELAAARADCLQKAESQRLVMLQARRRCRLLERLRERRLLDWEQARDHELETLASEAYLARWFSKTAI
jgi:hypothetical protein